MGFCLTAAAFGGALFRKDDIFALSSIFCKDGISDSSGISSGSGVVLSKLLVGATGAEMDLTGVASDCVVVVVSALSQATGATEMDSTGAADSLAASLSQATGSTGAASDLLAVAVSSSQTGATEIDLTGADSTGAAEMDSTGTADLTGAAEMDSTMDSTGADSTGAAEMDSTDSTGAAEMDSIGVAASDCAVVAADFNWRWRAVSSRASCARPGKDGTGALVAATTPTRCVFLVTLVVAVVPDLFEGGNRFLLRVVAIRVVVSVAPEGELVATLFLMRADARLGLASTSGAPPLDVGDMVVMIQ